MNNLRDILYHYYPISDESATKFSEILVRKKYKNKTELCNNYKFYILLDGLVRSYTIHDNGSVRIGTFLSKSSIFTSIKPLSILSNCVIQEIKFDCLSDVILYEGSFSEFIKLTKKHHDLSLLYNKTLEAGIRLVIEKAHVLIHLDGMGRYLHLKNQYPNIENLIKLNDIASYINVTPIQLSRIRKTLYSSK
jgi:CRP-like cAMP-binding protein